MRRKFNRTQRNYIIAGLCMILVIMGVGYAAFSSQLKISGTSNITSNWDIEITDIDTVFPSQMGGGDTLDGYNISEPTYTPASATFSAGFKLPGSQIMYMVEISNLGSIDGQVGIANLSCGDNPVIICQAVALDKNPLQEEPTNGFNFINGNQNYSDVNFPLKVGEKHYIMIIVGYDDVTEQPTDLSASIKLDLTYTQYSDGTSSETTLIGGQEVPIMVSRDGLYVDDYEAGRYIYKGSDPNNYINFNGETWRIISKEADGTYKIVNRVQSDTIRFDDNSNDWTTSEMNTYLNTSYYNNLSNTEKKHITSHVFYDGSVTENSVDLQSIVNEEKSSSWIGNIGLINASDYIKSFISNDAINNLWGFTNQDITKYNYQNSYMTEILGGRYGEHWTINAVKGSDTELIDVYIEGNSSHAYIKTLDCRHDTYDNMSSTTAAVAIFLNSDVKFSGTGTQADPYKITN